MDQMLWCQASTAALLPFEISSAKEARSK